MGMNDDKGIMVGEKYKVEIDSLNTTLYEKRVRKNKNTHYWYPVKYFSPEYPERALHYIIDAKIMETGYKDLETVINMGKELHEFIDTVIREVAPQLIK